MSNIFNFTLWFRSVTTVILLASFSSVSCQPLDFVTSYKPVGEEKLTTIEYENYPYIVTGWVKKNTFVDGSPIVISVKPSKNRFTSLTPRPYPVMEGVFCLEDGTPVIKGEAQGALFKRATLNESFRAAISSYSNVTSIQDSNDKYSNLYGNIDGVVKGAFVVYNTDEKKLSAEKGTKLSNNQKNFDWILKSVEAIEKKVSISIGRRSLKGIFIQRATEDGCGYEQWIDQIDWNGNPIISVKHAKIVSIPSSDVPKDTCWVITFANEDIYRGDLNGSGDIYLHTGEIIKSTSQTTISGLLTGDKHPIDYRWIIFKDGEEEFAELEKTWWDNISTGLNNEEKSNLLSHYKSPTQLRDSARNFIDKKEQIQKQKELQILEEQIQNRKRYVAKYGEKYGNAIADKQVIEGMTRQMVCEFLPAECFYTITKSGATETWHFNERQVISALRMQPEGVQLLMAIQFFGGSVGDLIRTSNIFGIADVPKVICFYNNKVKSITR